MNTQKSTKKRYTEKKKLRTKSFNDSVKFIFDFYSKIIFTKCYDERIRLLKGTDVKIHNLSTCGRKKKYSYCMLLLVALVYECVILFFRYETVIKKNVIDASTCSLKIDFNWIFYAPFWHRRVYSKFAGQCNFIYLGVQCVVYECMYDCNIITTLIVQCQYLMWNDKCTLYIASMREHRKIFFAEITNNSSSLFVHFIAKSI